MAIGEEGRPHGVGVGGTRARGVKGGEGSEERPVPPIMAMGTASGDVSMASGVVGRRGGCLPAYVVGRLSILRMLLESEIERRGLIDLFGSSAFREGKLE